ncbi:YhbY family RNA-binding protein [Candidatus Lokiarchaeum ossiferum]|uniref:YhbY family RNA-binding protein n=1 Tax=Candidatus Lokiarchaeum ossiferum TaxID=2951803 RepID=UPI00352FC02E
MTKKNSRMSLELFHQVRQERAHVIIGKTGVTPSVLEHIKNHLKKNKIVKLKVMPDMVTEHGMDHFIAAVMKGLKIVVLDARGHTFIISKKKVARLHVPKKYGKLIGDNEEITPQADGESEEETVVLDENGEVVDMNPEFIDYDDENLLHRIDQQSEEIYGAIETKQPKKKVKRPRPNLRDNKKFPKTASKSGARSNSSKFGPKKGKSRSGTGHSSKRTPKFKKRS